MTNPDNAFTPALLKCKLAWRITLAHLLLAGIMLLSAALHFTNLSAIGDANPYYTAAVKSMLQSWRNFFFVAAEPGGSVTVDKPPLGLWVEAAFAFGLGVQGWVVSLPNILAGIFSVPVLYHLIRKYLGEPAGLVAALTLTVTPVLIATNRNNTMDGMLVFTLLLAAGSFMAATESGKARQLHLGAFLLGLGFNIKMLQAFLPLPAFYALYLLGAETAWWKKILNVGVSALILLVVSLSWAIIVDLTPPEQRPFIGSSQGNTVMELIVGHNALARLFSPHPGKAPSAPPPARQMGGGDYLSPNPFVRQPQPPGGAPFHEEVGLPGPLRFFLPPLSRQMSWLLPFALIALIILLFSAQPRLPLGEEHKTLVLWGGWLLTCLIFFSMVEGIFHAYYTIMLAPALGAAVGAGITLFWRSQTQRAGMNVVFILAAALTIAFQIFTAAQTWFNALVVTVPAILLIMGAILLFVKAQRSLAYVIVLTAMLYIPWLWTGMTVLDRSPNVNLPTAFDGGKARQTGARPVPPQNSPNQAPAALVTFLQANTREVKYLVAVPNAQFGAPLVLVTGRPVLYLGGFSGTDPLIDPNGLAEMVEKGELRYLLFDDLNPRRDIAAWLQTSCTVVVQFNQKQPPPAQLPGQPAPPHQPPKLYRCDPKSSQP